MDTMNALVWKGDGALSLERRPVPTLQGPRDAIVRGDPLHHLHQRSPHPQRRGTPCPARRGAGP